MILLLRVVRGFLGIVFVAQIMGMLSTLLNLLLIYSSDLASHVLSGEVIAFIFVKLIAGAIAGFIYFYLRTVVNKIYANKMGENSKLLKSHWSL